MESGEPVVRKSVLRAAELETSLAVLLGVVAFGADYLGYHGVKEPLTLSSAIVMGLVPVTVGWLWGDPRASAEDRRLYRIVAISLIAIGPIVAAVYHFSEGKSLLSEVAHWTAAVGALFLLFAVARQARRMMRRAR